MGKAKQIIAGIKNPKFRSKLIAIVIIVVFVFGVAMAKIHSAVADGRILQNVTINHIDVSGLSKDEASQLMNSYVQAKGEDTVTIKAGDNTAEVTVADLNLVVKTEKAVEEACAVGRGKNPFVNLYQIVTAKNKQRNITIEVSISDENAKTLMSDHKKELVTKTKNASIKRKNGKFKIIDEVYGVTIKEEESIKKIKKAVTKNWDQSDFSIKLSVTKEKPEYTAKDMEQIKDVLGTYTTDYSTSASGRKKNVARGAKLINGTILYPGQTLSVYKKVSPLEKSNGYELAPSYASGKVVTTYGGGICQVSTTLYNAVLRAELKVVERSNHSMTVHYVPLAADAAIAGTEKDFKFKNNQKTPIYIEGTTNGSTITFTIYGKETRAENRTIEFESKTISVKNPSTKKLKDPTLAKGKEKVQSNGTTGYVAEYYKIIKIDGKETERVLINKSTYNSSPKIVLVGTKKEKASSATTKDGKVVTTAKDGKTATTAKKTTKTTAKKKK